MIVLKGGWKQCHEDDSDDSEDYDSETQGSVARCYEAHRRMLEGLKREGFVVIHKSILWWMMVMGIFFGLVVGTLFTEANVLILKNRERPFYSSEYFHSKTCIPRILPFTSKWSLYVAFILNPFFRNTLTLPSLPSNATTKIWWTFMRGMAQS